MKQNRLDLYRRRKGMTQEELAAATGVPVETIKAIEEGEEISVPAKQIVAMATELGADPGIIFNAPPEATGPSIVLNPNTISEDDLVKARATVDTLYLLADGFRADILSGIKTAEERVVAGCLLRHLDGMEFLLGNLKELLEVEE